jgi:hypothetical protein
MATSLQVIACPKCGSRTIKVTSLVNEDHFFCQTCQHDWEHTPAQLPLARPPSGKASDRRSSERRLPTRLVPPKCHRNCSTTGGMVVETRTERFVYFRCPACSDLLALRKPAGRIELPPSTNKQLESDCLREPAGGAPSSTEKRARTALPDVELWRLRKGDRELRCMAYHVPTGVNLRLIEGEESRRTEFFEEGPQSEQCAQLWRRKLTDRGWA